MLSVLIGSSIHSFSRSQRILQIEKKQVDQWVNLGFQKICYVGEVVDFLTGSSKNMFLSTKLKKKKLARLFFFAILASRILSIVKYP